ncbi:MAG: 3-hexulose-6-phosphate synthase [Oscillospiraceae bacterium]|nr:3-hexulose-6-phosphate synthase [Oscillospiraceae bacterium]
MKLQLALDTDSLYWALKFTEKVVDYIDIIEIGTPFVYEEGMHAVRAFHKHFREKELLADLKIMDGGAFEAMQAYEAGADYITIMAVTDILTVKAAIAETNKWGKQAVIDFLCEPNMEQKIREMEEVGAHYLAVHTGADQQAAGRTPLEDLKMMTAHAKYSKIAVAGGISSQTVAQYAALKPDIVIVGSAIIRAKDPVDEAKRIREALQG